MGDMEDSIIPPPPVKKITKCAYLQERIDECIAKAAQFKDAGLKMFYLSAAEGFRIRMNKMTLEELASEM